MRIRGPFSVTATVCSKCAASDPSAVEIDQRSSARTMSSAPGGDHRLDRERHPRRELRAAARLAVVRHLRLLVHRAPDAVADQRPDDGEPGRLGRPLDGRRDVADVVAGSRLGDPGRERRLADVEQPLRLGVDLAHRERVRGVGHEAVERHADVDRDDVAVLERYEPGIPWTTIEFGDAQIEAGKPR